MVKIDIGAGKPDEAKKGYLSIDINPDYKPDIVADLNKGIPFKDGEVEAIYSDNSLEHMDDPFFVLKECYRVLKPGGKLELILPNTQYFPFMVIGWFGDILWWWNVWMKTPWKRDRTIHITLWTKEQAKIVLQRLGFKIIRAEGFFLGKEFRILCEK